MNISSLLSHDNGTSGTAPVEADSSRAARPYMTRRSSAIQEPHTRSRMSRDTAGSPKQRKAVSFWLVMSTEREEYHRLPLRVHVQPHDETQSIIQTVRGFFGLPDKSGVSFQDEQGITLVPRYDNFANVSGDDAAHVRVIQEPRRGSHAITVPHSPVAPLGDSRFDMLPPFQTSRSASRNAKRESMSPVAGPSRNSGPSRTPSREGLSLGKTEDRYGEYDAGNGFSESEAGSISVSSSRRDHLASAEISVDNILKGNRRKRAKFESSELPLFNPPQVPFSASMSSASPQRRWTGQTANAPVTVTNQYTFSYNQMMPTSSVGAQGDRPSVRAEYGQLYATPQAAGNHYRTRLGANPLPPRFANTSGAMNLPTPAPTVGSAMSDEDVALQLMRLGDASNLSNGRTSTSTVDDALSGKAEVASSVEGSDGGEAERTSSRLPRKAVRSMPTTSTSGKRKLSKLETDLPSADTAWSSVEEYEHGDDGSFKGNSDEIGPESGYGRPNKSKSKQNRNRSSNGSSIAGGARTKTSANAKSRQVSISGVPPSPYSLPPSNRKNSSTSSVNPQQQLAGDEEDMCVLPRCQRCRKSKKGCDRQRPCGRCKEAGLGAADCISEDEASGRKGRFGRHMGVAIKKASLDSMSPTEATFGAASPGYIASTEGNKRRKR